MCGDLLRRNTPRTRGGSELLFGEGMLMLDGSVEGVRRGKMRESPLSGNIYIAYVLCKTDAVWGKTCTTSARKRTLRCFLCSQTLLGDVLGFWIGFFCARFQIFFSRRLPPSFHCHLPLRENRRAPVDFTLNPRSRAQSAEDRTARQR